MKKLIIITIITLLPIIIISEIPKLNISFAVTEETETTKNKYQIIRQIFEQQILKNQIYFSLLTRGSDYETIKEEQFLGDIENVIKDIEFKAANIIITFQIIETIITDTLIVRIIKYPQAEIIDSKSIELRTTTTTYRQDQLNLITNLAAEIIGQIKDTINMKIIDTIDNIGVRYDKNIRVGDILNVRRKNRLNVYEYIGQIRVTQINEHMFKYEKIDEFEIQKNDACFRKFVGAIEVKTDKPVYTLNENIDIILTTDTDGYFYIFSENINGEITLLYPQQIIQDTQGLLRNNRISQGEKRILPFYMAIEPKGQSEIIAILLKKQIPAKTITEDDYNYYLKIINNEYIINKYKYTVK